MFVGGGHVTDESYNSTQAIDVNRDGYMDLVGPRTIFYNMGDNRFVASRQPGRADREGLERRWHSRLHL